MVGTLTGVLLAVLCHAQTIKGTVKDTAGKAIPYATISLKNSVSNTIIVYTAADSKGSFALQVPANTVAAGITVEARALGYGTAVKHIAGFDLPVEFTLTEAVNQLQEVVVKSNRPVLRTHGDTLSYKVSEFAGSQDRTIGEVIKKLPGITISADGTIRYNGKAVSTVYIGGDNLLDDKYSIATNSIPQGAVALVQVLENNQPIKALQNKVLSEDVALNLEFKKGAKLHLMGQESIGAGLPGHYDVDLNAMIFRNNYKAINYLSGNNTGYDVRQNLVSHNQADYLQRVDNPLPAPLLSLGATSPPALSQNRYLFNQSAVLNLNNLINLEKNVQLKVNAYYVHDKQKQDYTQQTAIFLPGDTVRYNELQHNRSATGIFHTQFTLNINREKYYLSDIFLIDHKNLTSYSGLKTDSAALNQLLQDNTRSFSNEFNLIRTLRSNKIIQIYSYFSRSTKPEKLAINPGYNAAVFNNDVPYAQLVQQVNIPGWYTNNYFSFRIPSSLITQGYRAGFSVQSQRLVSDLNIVQNNNSLNLQSDSARNHVNWAKQKLYAEAAYDLPGRILKAKLTLPVILQQISYSERLQKLDKSLTRWFFNPQLNVKYQVGAENYASFFYTHRNQVGTIESVYPGYILTNYRTLSANNALLTEQQNDQAGISFSYRRALTLFFWNVSAVYDHRRANNIVSSVIANNIQKGIALPYPNNTDSWIWSGSISKYVFALRTTFSGAVQRQNSRSVQIQNNALLPFSTVSGTVNLSADTKLGARVNVSYKVTWMQTRSHSPAAVSTHQIDQWLQQASVNYDPADNIQFKISGEHYFTRQQGNPDLKYFFADASVKFRPNKSKIDFELSASNFLDVKTYSSLYLSANTFTANSYTLPGRIMMIRVKFNF